MLQASTVNQLLDDQSVDNVHITSAAHVWTERHDGILIHRDPVAESDSDLADFLHSLRCSAVTPERP